MSLRPTEPGGSALHPPTHPAAQFSPMTEGQGERLTAATSGILLTLTDSAHHLWDAWLRHPRPKSHPKGGCLSLSCPMALLMMPCASPGSSS